MEMSLSECLSASVTAAQQAGRTLSCLVEVQAFAKDAFRLGLRCDDGVDPNPYFILSFKKLNQSTIQLGRQISIVSNATRSNIRKSHK